jgi:hypothetical protein
VADFNLEEKQQISLISMYVLSIKKLPSNGFGSIQQKSVSPTL